MAEPTNQHDPFSQLEKEVSSDLHPALQFITDHIKHIVIVLGAILLAVGAYAGYSTWQSSQVKKAENELGAILVAPDSETKIEKLRAYLQDAPERLQASARLALAETLMSEQEFEQAAEQWAALKQEKSDIRFVAWLGQTKCLLLAGQPELALKELSQLKSKAPEAYSMIIARQTGQAAEAAGQYAEAIRNYQQLASQAPPEDRAFLQARIKELEAKL